VRRGQRFAALRDPAVSIAACGLESLRTSVTDEEQLDRAPAHDRTVGSIRAATIANAHDSSLTCSVLLDEKTRSRGSYIGTDPPRCCTSQIAVCRRSVRSQCAKLWLAIFA
jgi:hypothetical protein